MDVASSKATSGGTTETLYLVERGGVFEVWKDRDDVPVRDAPTVDVTNRSCCDKFTASDGADAGRYCIWE